MTPFKLTEELISTIEQLIDAKDNAALLTMMEEYHYADIAEVIDELNEDHATYLIKLLDQKHIPFDTVGRHRRIKANDLFRFKARRDTERRKALSDLIAADAEDGLD